MSERPSLWEDLAESNEEDDALIQGLEEGGDNEALLQVVQETTSVPRTNWWSSSRSTRMFLFHSGTCGRSRQSIAWCTRTYLLDTCSPAGAVLATPTVGSCLGPRGNSSTKRTWQIGT